MKPPRCYEALLALILLALGGVFSLLGALCFVLSLPVRGGDAHTFLLGGLPLLLAGALLLCRARRLEHDWERLRTQGRAVPGKLVPRATRRHWYINWNSSGFHRNSPWTVLCIYRWEDGTREVRSQFLWQKPREGDQQTTVYVDPLDPRRAWIDPDTLIYETN